jgi:hypothetical protein
MSEELCGAGEVMRDSANHGLIHLLEFGIGQPIEEVHSNAQVIA